MKKIAFLFILATIFYSCNKVEGEGGTSSIKGTLRINDVNGLGELQSTYMGADEDVFIIYGSGNTTQNDKATTSFDGTYRFDNLMEGSYKVYAYSKCTSCESGTEEVLVDVVISDKNQVITAAEILIEK
jgi:hypothetical protein